MPPLTKLQKLLKDQERKVRAASGEEEPKRTVFDRPTTTRFRCMEPGCGEVFTTQVACERHPHRRIECVLVQMETAR